MIIFYFFLGIISKYNDNYGSPGPFLQCVSMTKTGSRHNKASHYHSNLADKVVQSMKYKDVNSSMKFRIKVWYCDKSMLAPQSAESSLVDWLGAEGAASASLTAVPRILTEKKRIELNSSINF